MNSRDVPEIRWHDTDLLIIGGGTAGCMAAVTARERDPKLEVLVVEKANIRRSGCLAAGMNAINAHINPGETPESFTRFVREDACGLIREDLVFSSAQRLNEMVQKVESWGLPIMKDAEGRYRTRGRWNVEIMGEALKPILARAVLNSGVKVLNRVAVTDLLSSDGRVAGAIGVGVRDGQVHAIAARAVIVATGGAAGVYRPNNPGSAHHKIWYCPFNTGAGYAMGLRAGAELTSLEMRFIALRTKDVIAPTGTLALGFKAHQVNALGEEFMKTRFSSVGGEGAPTPWRVYGPTREVMEGRGPCYLDTRGLSPERVSQLKQAYLNMYPGIVLYWAANGFDPSTEMVEICGTEPYIMGGHCQAGYWVDPGRRTTVTGLYAAGDVSGGAPYKFVSGCWAEGAIAAESATEDLPDPVSREDLSEAVAEGCSRALGPLSPFYGDDTFVPEEGEERLQKIMDEYAGGLSTNYQSSEAGLKEALRRVDNLRSRLDSLAARDPHELLAAHELIDRVWVASALVRHMLLREETRWPAFHWRTDFPERNDESWQCFVNSRYDRDTGQFEMLTRPYIKSV